METLEVYTKNALVNDVVNARLLLKYRVKEYFVRFVGCESAIKRAKDYLNKTQDIPLDTISYDLNLLAGDSATIPNTRLQKYAAFFGVSVDSLKNETIINH